MTCLVLLPVCMVRKARTPQIKPLKAHLPTGIIMGFLLFGAMYFQQWGLEFTTASKSGFITALYMIFVLIISLLMGKKISALLFASVALAITGAAFLSLDFSEGFFIGRGELLTLVCAILFALHIIYIDIYGSGLDSAYLCAIQFGACFVIGTLGTLLFEQLTWAQIVDNIGSILYVGALSGAIGYTFQIVGQKYTDPTLCSIVMCTESVFAALGGWLLGGELLSPLEYMGCALLLAGCIIAQLPDSRLNKSPSSK